MKSYVEESHFVRLTQQFNCQWSPDSFDTIAATFAEHLKAIGGVPTHQQLLKSFIELQVKAELQRSQNLLKMLNLNTDSKFTDYWQTHRLQPILIMGDYLISFINNS